MSTPSAAAGKGPAMRHLAQHTFSATPQTVRVARDFAMQALGSWGGCRRGDDLRICVSELAGNAVRHGSPNSHAYLVRLIRHPDCLHVEVHDRRERATHLGVRPPAHPVPEGIPPWDCPGSKGPSHQAPSDTSSPPNHCPNASCSPSACAVACA
ncbi:ATP-binding protein [Streptomyces sp. NPDC048191]|uniref:ATP-binding protein n=1 Tax=Streptomyces sp. NPDC048191 TaxID=3155484 RepID=UPI0033E7641D